MKQWDEIVYFIELLKRCVCKYIWLLLGCYWTSSEPCARLWPFQVRLLGKEEPSDWHSGLAVALGDCDRLVFLLLRGGASEPHRRPPAVAGHRSGWYHPILTGQCQADLRFSVFSMYHPLSCFNHYFHWHTLHSYLCISKLAGRFCHSTVSGSLCRVLLHQQFNTTDYNILCDRPISHGLRCVRTRVF